MFASQTSIKPYFVQVAAPVVEHIMAAVVVTLAVVAYFVAAYFIVIKPAAQLAGFLVEMLGLGAFQLRRR